MVEGERWRTLASTGESTEDLEAARRADGGWYAERRRKLLIFFSHYFMDRMDFFWVTDTRSRLTSRRLDARDGLGHDGGDMMMMLLLLAIRCSLSLELHASRILSRAQSQGRDGCMWVCRDRSTIAIMIIGELQVEKTGSPHGLNPKHETVMLLTRQRPVGKGDYMGKRAPLTGIRLSPNRWTGAGAKRTVRRNRLSLLFLITDWLSWSC